jgi:hypothetical protein
LLRSQTRLRRRRAVLSRRIKALDARIKYLEDRFVRNNEVIPPTPLPCCLCLESGEGTLVGPHERPKCRTPNCQYVICDACYCSLRANSYPPSSLTCPGCRSSYEYVGGGSTVVARHIPQDPFSVISDDDNTAEDISSSDGDGEETVDEEVTLGHAVSWDSPL